jgi:hypothetical protein
MFSHAATSESWVTGTSWKWAAGIAVQPYASPVLILSNWTFSRSGVGPGSARAVSPCRLVTGPV